MIRIAHIGYLFLLFALPLLVFFYARYRKKQHKEWRAFAQNSRNNLFVFGQPKRLPWSMLYVFIVLLTCGIFALSNPQINLDAQEVEIESSDVFIALDISQSMLTDDLKPNRLTRAKNLAQQIIEKLEGNRVGLILFAGEAYVFMPLSSDVSAAVSFVKAANIDMVPTQGTSLSAAIRLANQSFSEDGGAGKSIIIISDGEDHEEEIDLAINEAKDENVYIFTVAVGTDEGAYIPDSRTRSYVYDESGKPVKSIVNKSMLKEIASKSNATFYDISTEKNIDIALQRNIDQMEKQVAEVMKFAQYDSIYQYFLIPVYLLIIGQLFWPFFSYVKAKK